jgi:hypothetical protein
MTLTPILASDTTAAFLLPLVIFFWIVIGGGTLAGLIALGFYCFKRAQRSWGMLLGTFSVATGAFGLLVLCCTVDVEPLVLVAVLTPLIIGILDLILWKRRRLT